MATQINQLEKTGLLADQAHTLVQSAMTVSMERAVQAYDKALESITGLTNIDLNYPASFTPEPFDWDIYPTIEDVTKPMVPNWLSMGMSLPALTVERPVAPTSGVPPVFNKPIVTLEIPNAPAPIDLGTIPDKPLVDWNSITYPTDPVIVYPVMDVLTAITIPAFVMPAFPPPFVDVPPDFVVGTPGITPNWTESTYNPDLLDEVKAVILRLMDGNAIPAAVEEAMWDRARGREDVTTLKAVSEAYSDWAGRGFTMPPGMLVEQVNAARQQSMLSANTLNRDVAIKHAEWMQENVKFSVVQGLAYETVLINLWENAVKRAFEIAKMTVEMGLKLYEVQVSVFSARISAYKIAADVWKTQLEAVVVELDAYKAQLDAEKTKGEINEQKVRVFTARMNALQVVVDVYKAQVSVAETKAGVIKTQIEAYAVDIRAYAEWLNAQKVSFEAYDVQVRAETSKATFLETATRAFAAEVQAFSTVEDVKIRRYETGAKVMAIDIDAYKAKLESVRTQLDMVINTNKVELDRYSLNVDMYKADQSLNVEEARLYTAAKEGLLRSQLAYFNAKVQEWSAASQAMVARADLQSRAMQASAANSTGLANATMSAVHYNAGFSGGGSMSASFSDSN